MLGLGSRARLLTFAFASFALATACASLKDGAPASDAGSDTGGSGTSSGSSGTSSGSSGATSGGPSDDGGPAVDGSTDGSTDAGPDTGQTGLDPDLPLPPLNGTPCDQPGNETRCAGVAACRMATPDSGRCEDCPAGTCGQLIGKSCTLSGDCDINLECFRGKCTFVCSFLTPQTCGGTRKCIDVGYRVDSLGLCDANPPY